jgi:hypothetical protein
MLRLYPSGERDFFTWDGGVRPPKKVHIEPAESGKLSLTIAGEKTPAAMRQACAASRRVGGGFPRVNLFVERATKRRAL